MTERESIGSVLESLGVNLNLPEHLAVTDVVLVAKVINMNDGHVNLAVATSTNCDWLTHKALLAAATEAQDSPGPCECGCHGDDRE